MSEHKVFEAVQNNRDGSVTFEFHLKDGCVYVAIPGTTELAIVSEGQGMAFDFSVQSGPDVLIKYCARRT